jgi:hypothetical protein
LYRPATFVPRKIRSPGPLEGQAWCQPWNVFGRRRDEDDVQLEFARLRVVDEVTVLVEDPAGDRIRAPNELVPPRVEVGVGGVIDALLPVAETERCVLASAVDQPAVVGSHPQDPQVVVNAVERGDRRVVVRGSKFVERGGNSLAALSAPRLGGVGGLRRGGRPVQVGHRRQPHSAALCRRLGDVDRDLGAHAAGGREHDVVELQIGCPIVGEAGHRVAADLGDPVRSGAVEHGETLIGRQLVECDGADFREVRGVESPRG